MENVDVDCPCCDLVTYMWKPTYVWCNWPIPYFLSDLNSNNNKMTHQEYVTMHQMNIDCLLYCLFPLLSTFNVQMIDDFQALPILKITTVFHDLQCPPNDRCFSSSPDPRDHICFPWLVLDWWSCEMANHDHPPMLMAHDDDVCYCT